MLHAEMIPQAKSYQVGVFNLIEANDKWFDTWQKASEYALELTNDYDVIGVWASQAEGGSLLAMAYEREIFARWE